MEQLVPTEQLGDYQGYFLEPHVALVYASIVAGNTAAQLWEMAEADGPPHLLLWDKGNNVFYLAGECKASAAYQPLADLITTRLRPQALVERRPRFKVRALSASLEQALPSIFANATLREYPLIFYAHDATSRPPQVAPPTLAGVSIVPLTEAVLMERNLVNSADVRTEIRWMWPSEDRFFVAGFGTLALVHDQIICWCTAEYVGPQRCGVGITTLRPYEGRGVATATAASFVQQARHRGLTACWECGRDNHGSARVAEKVGFVCQAEEQYWLGSFTD